MSTDGLSTSLDLHIPPNLELIIGNRCRGMKCLESNFVCMNVLSLPVGKQHDITLEISERKDIQKG